MYGSIKSKRSTLLVGEKIFLRTSLISDYKTMQEWENNPDNWKVSNTKEPFTDQEIKDFILKNQHIYTDGQMRYMICLKESNLPIGCIDLFQYDAKENSIGIGILIAKNIHREKGYAKEALGLLLNYCCKEFKIVYFFCNIFKENLKSISLFESCNFSFVREQLLDGNKVNYYQLIKKS